VAWDQRPDRRTRRAFLHLPYSCASPCGPAILVTQDPPPAVLNRVCADGPPVDVRCFPNGVDVRCAPSFRAVRPLLAAPSVVPFGTRPAPSWHLRENFGRQARQEYSDHKSTRGPRLPTHSRLRPIYSRRPGRLRYHRQRMLDRTILHCRPSTQFGSGFLASR
jgi:hypothetical protein